MYEDAGPGGHSRKDLIALTALCLIAEEPRHPYEIQRLVRWRHKDYAVGKTRALYRAIEELTEAGYVEAAETSREGRRPERTIYRVTEEGREALEVWLEELLERPVVEYPVFSVALGLIVYLRKEQARSMLAARTVALRALIAAQREGLTVLHEQVGLPRAVLLENEHALALVEAELAWLRAVLDDMDDGRLSWDEEQLRAQFQALHDAEVERMRRFRGDDAAQNTQESEARRTAS